jgi:hypothetical protein
MAADFVMEATAVGTAFGVTLFELQHSDDKRPVVRLAEVHKFNPNGHSDVIFILRQPQSGGKPCQYSWLVR